MTPLLGLILLSPLLKAEIYRKFLPILEPSTPCQNIQWSVEHVIPRSLIQREIADDVGNLILLPAKLNHARSNFRYGNVQTGVSIPACNACYSESCPFRGKLSTTRGDPVFEPPSVFKPLIAKSVNEMLAKYPFTRGRVETFVINNQTLIEWNRIN